VEGIGSWVEGLHSVREVAMGAAHSGCSPSAVMCPMAEEEGDASCFEASRRRRGG
jgi:hypothetical protein